MHIVNVHTNALYKMWLLQRMNKYFFLDYIAFYGTEKESYAEVRKNKKQ